MGSHTQTHTIGPIRCCPDEQVKKVLCPTRISCNVVALLPLRRSKGSASCHINSNNNSNNKLMMMMISRERRHQRCCSSSMWRICSTTVGLEEQSSTEEAHQDSEEVQFPNPPTSDELKALLVDSERTKLIKKLSEANQQNRFLKRQLQGSEDALVNFKRELAAIELDVQALVALAEEVTNAGIPVGTRKINGKYIHSHLLSRLEAVQKKLKDQTKDVEAAQAKEVFIFWVGMAESVQVMGTFDGWSQGEHLSPEYNGSYTKFSTTLLLRPGRYQVKFLVDGEWRISPEFPTIGEGLTENNLLVVE